MDLDEHGEDAMSDVSDVRGEEAMSDVSDGSNHSEQAAPRVYVDDGVLKCSLCHWETSACSCAERYRYERAEPEPELHCDHHIELINAGMQFGLAELRESNLLCDITVCVEDKEFPCHRLLLRIDAEGKPA